MTLQEIATNLKNQITKLPLRGTSTGIKPVVLPVEPEICVALQFRHGEGPDLGVLKLLTQAAEEHALSAVSVNTTDDRDGMPCVIVYLYK